MPGMPRGVSSRGHSRLSTGSPPRGDHGPIPFTRLVRLQDRPAVAERASQGGGHRRARDLGQCAGVAAHRAPGRVLPARLSARGGARVVRRRSRAPIGVERRAAGARRGGGRVAGDAPGGLRGRRLRRRHHPGGGPAGARPRYPLLLRPLRPRPGAGDARPQPAAPVPHPAGGERAARVPVRALLLQHALLGAWPVREAHRGVEPRHVGLPRRHPGAPRGRGGSRHRRRRPVLRRRGEDARHLAPPQPHDAQGGRPAAARRGGDAKLVPRRLPRLLGLRERSAGVRRQPPPT